MPTMSIEIETTYYKSVELNNHVMKESRLKSSLLEQEGDMISTSIANIYLPGIFPHHETLSRRVWNQCMCKKRGALKPPEPARSECRLIPLRLMKFKNYRRYK